MGGHCYDASQISDLVAGGVPRDVMLEMQDHMGPNGCAECRSEFKFQWELAHIPLGVQETFLNTARKNNEKRARIRKRRIKQVLIAGVVVVIVVLLWLFFLR